MEPEPRVLRIREAIAEIARLGVTVWPSQVPGLIRNGRLVGEKVGKSLLVQADSIPAFVAWAKQQKPGAPPRNVCPVCGYRGAADKFHRPKKLGKLAAGKPSLLAACKALLVERTDETVRQAQEAIERVEGKKT